MPVQLLQGRSWLGLAVFAFFGQALPATTDGPQFSPQQLQEDLAVIDAAIRSSHPDFIHSADVAEVEKLLLAIGQRLEQPMSRDEAWRELAMLNPALADGHFFVAFSDWRADSEAHLNTGGAFFPFEIQVTAEAEVFIKSQLGGGHTPHADSRIVSIDGMDAAEIVRELLARVHGDTYALRAELLSRRWWWYYWRMYGPKTDFDIVFNQRADSANRVPASSAMPAVLADEASFERQFNLKLLPCKSALLTVSSFYWPDKERFFEFARSAFIRLRDEKVETLLIDIRANGGGDDDMWMRGLLPYIANKPYRWASGYRKRIIDEYRDEGETSGDVVAGTIDRWIPAEPDNPARYSGKTIVLTGPSTYSSAIVFANVMQYFDFGTIAATGQLARADQTGGVQKLSLPNTGLAFWWPRFILNRPSAASEPEFLEPDVSIDVDPLRPDAAIEALLQCGVCTTATNL